LFRKADFASAYQGTHSLDELTQFPSPSCVDVAFTATFPASGRRKRAALEAVRLRRLVGGTGRRTEKVEMTTAMRFVSALT